MAAASARFSAANNKKGSGLFSIGSGPPSGHFGFWSGLHPSFRRPCAKYFIYLYVGRSSSAPRACGRSRRAERAERSPRAQLAAAPARHRADSIRANTTTARAPPSRERVVGPDRAAGFAERAPIVIRASRVRPQPPRRARRRPPRAQLAAAPHVTAPAQSEPTRRPRERRRAASEPSTLVAPPASPSVRRSPSAPRACGRSRRAERGRRVGFR